MRRFCSTIRGDRWRLWLPAGIILFLLAFSFLTWPLERAAAQSGGSSCMNCHETEGSNPVATQGDWHLQHAKGDLCAVCHGGDPKSSEKEAAHAGVLKNPLSQAEGRCGLCHPDDLADRVAVYAVQVGTEEPTAEPEATPEVTANAPAVAPAGVATAGAGGVTPEPAVTSAPVEATAQPATTAAPAPPAAPGGWFAALRFARGPLFQAALIVFALGMLYRLFQALRPGWRHTPSAGRRAQPGSIAASFARGMLIFPYLPGARSAFRRNPVTYVAGGLFHLGLLAVLFLTKTHMTAWKGVLGFGWPVLPAGVIPWLSAIGILAMLALLINRVIDPVLRLISGPSEWLNWLFVFLTLATGFILARGWWLPYEVGFSLHMFLVDFLLVWIPLSRISHFIFYFFSRTIHGVEYGPLPVAAPER